MDRRNFLRASLTLPLVPLMGPEVFSMPVETSTQWFHKTFVVNGDRVDYYENGQICMYDHMKDRLNVRYSVPVDGPYTRTVRFPKEED